MTERTRLSKTDAAPVYADAHWVVERTGCPAPYTWRIVGTPEGAFPAYVEPMDSQLAAMARIAALWAEYAGYLNRIIDDLRAAQCEAMVLGDEGIGGAEFTPEACAAEKQGGAR
jgi:hypothetical protein